MSRQRLVVAVAAAMAVTTACTTGGSARQAASPTPRTLAVGPTSTPTPSRSPTLAAAVDEVPPAEAIDVAYVQAVIDAIDARLGELAGHVKRAGALDEEAVAMLVVLYAGDARQAAISSWEGFVLPRLGDRPQPPRTEVVQLRSVSQGCVSFSAERDYSPLGEQVGGFPQPFSMALRPAERRAGANPTAWVVVQEGTDAEGQGRLLPDPCTEGAAP